MPRLELVHNEPQIKNPAITEKEMHAMQRAVIQLFDLWGLTDEQASILLGDIAVRTFQRWKKGALGRVSVDLGTRLSILMGIHKALRLLFREPERTYSWIRKPNKDFAGNSALDIMLAGQMTDLMRVRRYLDSHRSN